MTGNPNQDQGGSEKCVRSEGRMELNQDFYDLLHHFNAEEVEYLVVGGYAVMFYSEPRYSKDLLDAERLQAAETGGF